MTTLQPANVAEEEPIDLLRQRSGEDCTVVHLAQEIDAMFDTIGVTTEIGHTIPKSVDVKVPSTAPQGVDAAIVTLVVIGYRSLRFELISYTEHEGYRLYSFF